MAWCYVGRTMTRMCYLIWSHQALWDQEIQWISDLLDLVRVYEIDDHEDDACVDACRLYGPRRGTTSPANSNLVAAYDALSHTHDVVFSLEWYTLLENGQVIEIDPMIEWIYALSELVSSFTQSLHNDLDPEYLENLLVWDVHFVSFTPDLLHALNKEHGLALSDDYIQYFYTLFTSEPYQRIPTLSELYLFAQLNSEHCRHNIFNGRIIVDEQVYEKSLFRWIQDTYKQHPWEVVVAYADNGAILKAADDRYIVIKAETHNHPCLIAPFPGWATGSGWCYRDVMATGRWAMVEISTATYCVWDITRTAPYRSWHKTPQEILLEASRWVHDYGNCFAAPLINGSTLAVVEDLRIGEHTFSHAKPVVMAWSAGWTFLWAVDKEKKPGLLHIKLWWPDYAIGIWWAAASSMNSWDNKDALDFASVQRANPQMQIKVKKVLETIIHTCPEAIRNIHDYGAWWHGTNIFELYEPDDMYAWGGEVDIARLSVEDKTMTYHQILINESQERLWLLIDPAYIATFREICERENCPFDVVGEATQSWRVHMYDSRTWVSIVDVRVEDFLLKDRIDFPDTSVDLGLVPLAQDAFAQLDMLSVLAHPTVWSKSYIVHHVDRSVRWNIVQQQTVGRRQLPLADYGLFKTSPLHVWWTATAQGMRPYHTLLSPEAMVTWSLAEVLLNLSFVKSAWLSAVSLSGNWMRSAQHAWGKARLYKAVKALSLACQELWINIPVGKDSVSMKVIDDDKKSINAPGTLVLSWFVHVPDVQQRVTPVLRNVDSSFLWIPCVSREEDLMVSLQWGCAWSIASLLVWNIGATVPSIDMSLLASLYNLMQDLIAKEHILAWHDVSEWWLWACLVEMFLASDIGMQCDFSVLPCDHTMLRHCLLSEYPWVVVQVPKDHVSWVMTLIETCTQLSCYVLGDISHTYDAHTQEQSFVVKHTWMRDLTWSKKTLLDAWATYARKLWSSERESSFVLPKLLPWDMPSRITVTWQAKPRVMILRDEGTNGEHDMMTAFGLAWFDAIDTTVSDLITKKSSLEGMDGLVIPGWFSYGDWPRSWKAFAEVLRHNPLVNEQLLAARDRDIFVLWVCNGNQVLMELWWITESYDMPVAPMHHNDSGMFESRFLAVRVEDTDNRFFADMDWQVLPIWVAHGEGKYVLPDTDASMRVPVRYVDATGLPTDSYPWNPNGSVWWIAWVLSKDGNVLGMMPHPERSVLSHQLAYVPDDIDAERLTWMGMFRNLRKSV